MGFLKKGFGKWVFKLPAIMHLLLIGLLVNIHLVFQYFCSFVSLI